MFKNSYIVRKVAETDSRACFICYRPTTSVLVCETPNADFFYACPGHVLDPGFATLSEASKVALKEQELKKKEMEKLQKEWELIQERKTKNEKSEKKKTESSNNETSISTSTSTSIAPSIEIPTPPRLVYELNKGVFNLRLGAKRRASQEKKAKALLNTPGIFPKVPVHKPQ